MLVVQVISLHTHSVGETICDARASYAVRILCSKFFECPHSSICRMWCPEYPPPSRNENCQRGWDFRFDLIQNTPLPPKIKKKWSGLRTLSFRLVQNPPPPPMKMTYVEGAGVWRLMPHGYHLIR